VRGGDPGYMRSKQLQLLDHRHTKWRCGYPNQK